MDLHRHQLNADLRNGFEGAPITDLALRVTCGAPWHACAWMKAEHHAPGADS
jgi:hypothetical protein